MNRLSSSKKMSVVVLLVLVLVFLVYNAVWYLNFRAYDKLIDDQYDTPVSRISFNKRVGESTYTVKKPDYLQLTGNVAIDNADSSVGIIIWPSFMLKGVKDYGLALYDTVNDRGYMFYVDEDMNYDMTNRTGLTNDSESKAKDLFKRLQSEVDEQYRLIKNEFGSALNIKNLD